MRWLEVHGPSTDKDTVCVIIIDAHSHYLIKYGKERARERERERNRSANEQVLYILYILHLLMTPLAFGPKGHRQLAKLASLQECCRPIVQDITSWQHRILAEGNPQHISFAIDIEALCAESAALYPISIPEAKPLRFSHDAHWRSQERCALGRKHLLL